jgi:hypothetical protein
MLNVNVIAGIAGCTVLLAFWLRFRSAGARPALLAISGCVVIVAAVLVVTYPGGAGMLVAGCFITCLLSCMVVVHRARLRGPHRVPPALRRR